MSDKEIRRLERLVLQGDLEAFEAWKEHQRRLGIKRFETIWDPLLEYWMIIDNYSLLEDPNLWRNKIVLMGLHDYQYTKYWERALNKAKTEEQIDRIIVSGPAIDG